MRNMAMVQVAQVAAPNTPPLTNTHIFSMRPSMARRFYIGDVVTRDSDGMIHPAKPHDILYGFVTHVIHSKWPEDWYDEYEQEYAAVTHA